MITKTASTLCALAAALLCAICSPMAAAIDILVFDDNTVHGLAATAATNIDPTAVIGDSANFNTLLASQSWDAVLIDCPSNTPSGGWLPTIAFIANGGKVAMSFWDWDNDSGQGDPGLAAAFGSSGVTADYSLSGRTLTDAGTTPVFSGVTMSNSDWHDHWGDDGDAFGFTVVSGTVGMANLSGITDPVMVRGNGGRTIAAFLIDEAGDTWLSDGSGVTLWENMFYNLVPEPTAGALFVMGALACIARRPPARQRRQV
jgi:hypothetical protein